MESFTPFEVEILDSVYWQLQGAWTGNVSKRATTRILRATLRRIEPSPVARSLKLMAEENGDYDHAVPLSEIVNRLVDHEIPKEDVTKIICKFLVLVELTEHEHRYELKNQGMSSKMPEGWGWNDDVFARYDKAGIKLKML